VWSDRSLIDATMTVDLLAKTPRLSRPDDASASLEDRVRSYLDVNCVACHRPGGMGRAMFDARYGTPLAAQKLIDAPLISGDLGIPGARIVAPGNPQASALFQRLSRTDQSRMPPV